MQISLPPDLTAFIEDAVAAGRYPDTTAAVCDAVRTQRDAEAHLEWQRAEVMKGLRSLEEGGTVPYDSEAIMREALELFHQLNETPQA